MNEIEKSILYPEMIENKFALLTPHQTITSKQVSNRAQRILKLGQARMGGLT